LIRKLLLGLLLAAAAGATEQHLVLRSSAPWVEDFTKIRYGVTVLIGSDSGPEVVGFRVKVVAKTPDGWIFQFGSTIPRQKTAPLPIPTVWYWNALEDDNFQVVSIEVKELTLEDTKHAQ
jgi:hypothetical protein